MWIMGLIGVLAAAIPVAFLNPSLGFKRRRRDTTQQELVLAALNKFEKI